MYDDCKFELSNGRNFNSLFSSAFAITRNKNKKKILNTVMKRKSAST